MNTQKIMASLDQRIEIPLDLREFRSDLEEVVPVWVNIPRSIVKGLDLLKEDKDRGLLFVGKLIGLEEADARVLFEADNAFVGWLVERVMEIYNHYADGEAKKSTTG